MGEFSVCFWSVHLIVFKANADDQMAISVCNFWSEAAAPRRRTLEGFRRSKPRSADLFFETDEYRLS